MKPYVPLTKEQYDKAIGAGFTHESIVANERKRKTESIPTTPDQPSLTSSGVGSLPGIKQATQFGVGLGTSIGKAGLGLGQTFLKGANVVSNLMGLPKDQYNPAIAGIESAKQKLYTDPFKNELSSLAGSAGELTGTGAVFLAPGSTVEKTQGAITGLVNKIPAVSKTAQFGRGALGVVGRALPEATGAGASSLALSGGDIEKAKRDALLAGSASTFLGGAGALYRGAKDTGLLKSALSKTTSIPSGAFDEISQSGINAGATPENTLASARSGVTQLRKKMTQMWNDRLPIIADTYKDIRTGLEDTQISQLTKVIDEFGINPDLIPKNLKNISALESVNLIKGLNELDSLAVKASPKGAIVRQLKDELKTKIVNSFGGKSGEVAKLWKDYSVKSDILKNANDIVNTYKTNPKATVTAKNRLMAIFDENKPEFLTAIKDLEKETGVKITGNVASTKFKNWLPEYILKADGGLPTKSGIVDKLIGTLLLPITSPKIAGRLVSPTTKEAGVISSRLFGK